MNLSDEERRFLKLLVTDLRERYSEEWRDLLTTDFPLPESFSDKFDLHLGVEFEEADEAFEQLRDREIIDVDTKDKELDRGSYQIRYKDNDKGESVREIEYEGAVRGAEERSYFRIPENKLDEIEEELL